MRIKLNTNEMGHMTKMAVMPIYGETLKIALQKQMTHGLDTWFVGLGTRVLPRLFK